MAKEDYHTIAYYLLSYLYHCLKAEERYLSLTVKLFRPVLTIKGIEKYEFTDIMTVGGKRRSAGAFHRYR